MFNQTEFIPDNQQPVDARHGQDKTQAAGKQVVHVHLQSLQSSNSCKLTVVSYSIVPRLLKPLHTGFEESNTILTFEPFGLEPQFHIVEMGMICMRCLS